MNHQKYDTSGYRWTSTDTDGPVGVTKITVGCTVPKYGTRSHPKSLPGHYRPRLQTPTHEAVVSRYDIPHVDIYRSAREHGVTDADIDHALGAAEQDDGKVIYLGADRAGNMLEGGFSDP